MTGLQRTGVEMIPSPNCWAEQALSISFNQVRIEEATEYACEDAECLAAL